MTRKHFEAIANALRVTRPDIDAVEFVQWCQTRAAIANELRAFNFNFDRERFYAATDR